MNSLQDHILKSGASEQLINDFNALKESTTIEGQPRYLVHPTLESLAKIILGQSGGNKDMPLFELAHFVFGLSEMLGRGAEVEICLTPSKAVPNLFRTTLMAGQQTEQVSLTDEGMVLHYDAQDFCVRFGRMPVLVGLYEFLTSMDHFAHFEAIQTIFSDMCTSSLNEKTLKKASNALGALFRTYRMAHIVTQQGDGKFQRVIKFLLEKSPDQQIEFDDHTIFDFWRLHNKGNDYKGYRTVFDLFYDFSQAMTESGARTSAMSAQTLGLDFEAGEIDVAEDSINRDLKEDWLNPFEVFDDPFMKEVRFFKTKSERKPIEALMAYGPDVLALPLAFIRHEIFGQVQSGITTDLQVGRGKDSVEKRILCRDVESYAGRIALCQSILEHIRTLQASAAHPLVQDGNVVSLDATARKAAEVAFSKMTRKGFESSSDPEIFKRALPALALLETRLSRYLARLEAAGVVSEFEKDVDRFSQEFQSLYGEVLS